MKAGHSNVELVNDHIPPNEIKTAVMQIVLGDDLVKVSSNSRDEHSTWDSSSEIKCSWAKDPAKSDRSFCLPERDRKFDTDSAIVDASATSGGARFAKGVNLVIGRGGTAKTPFLEWLARENPSYRHYRMGEPIPGYSTSTGSVLASVTADIAEGAQVILIDSLKSYFFYTSDNLGKGGISRRIFQQLSDISSIAAARDCCIVAIANVLTDDADALKEIFEAARSSVNGFIEAKGGGNFNFELRDYVNFERTKFSVKLGEQVKSASIDLDLFRGGASTESSWLRTIARAQRRT